MLTIKKEISVILDTLKNAGFKTYIVGGCVRDALLKKTPADYDVTTDALPEDIKKLFSHTADTGIEHGTVTVITENGTPVEVTTFRTESGYDDMRRPKEVKFVSDIKLDLSRRDFTVNAMAYNEDDGLTDPFCGQKDLRKKLLRTVGSPKERFYEDALRIMRLFRFSSTLGFRIDPKTKRSALKLSPNLQKISAERVNCELIKAVSGLYPERLTPLIKSGGLKSFGIKSAKNLKRIKRLKGSENLKLFSFLTLCNADFDTVFSSLKFSNSIKNYCRKIKSIMFITEKSTSEEIKLALSVCGYDVFLDFLEYKAVIEKKNIKNIKLRAESIIKANEPYKISHLALNGEDLKALGLKDKEIGEALNKSIQEIRKYPEHNTKEFLINLIKKSN